jgi:hypothetical protein
LHSFVVCDTTTPVEAAASATIVTETFVGCSKLVNTNYIDAAMRTISKGLLHWGEPHNSGVNNN